MGESDYPERRECVVPGARRETTWLIESAGDEVFYDWRLLPGGSGAIQPVTSGYFAEDPAGACAARVLEAKSDGRRVAPACAKGSLGIVEAPASQPPCVESPAVGEIDPETLRCGALDDFALALADQVPERTWVTRHRGVVLTRQAQSVQIDTADPECFANRLRECDRCHGLRVDRRQLRRRAVPALREPAPEAAAGAAWAAQCDSPDRGVPAAAIRTTLGSSSHTVHEGSSVDVGCTTSGGDADCGGDTSSGEDGDSCSGDSGFRGQRGLQLRFSRMTKAMVTTAGATPRATVATTAAATPRAMAATTAAATPSGGGDDCSGDSGSGDCAGGETASMNASIGVGAVRQVTAAVCSLPQPRRFRPRVSAVTLVLCAAASRMRRAVALAARWRALVTVLLGSHRHFAPAVASVRGRVGQPRSGDNR